MTQDAQPPQDLAALNDRLMARNHALAEALSRAGKELAKAKAQISQITRPPLTFATMVRVDGSHIDEEGVRHASAEVIAGTRRMIVPIAASLNPAGLEPGRTVLLNENMVLVDQRDVDGVGTVRRVAQVLDDGRLIVEDNAGNPTVVRRATALAGVSLGPSDRVTVDSSGRLALELLPGEDDADLVLEETPDVTFADIGGLDEQIERIRDAVQLPFLHRELFERYNLNPPAHMLAEGTESGGVFLSVKGPELLNKFVGESERLIRLIFARARERAASGRPVIVFIDEMDSLLRTRGSGVSSDVETTIVPQFLAELDGVEQLDNVMVIGASNRVDMIDPAVLRPGRLDVKIRVDRPGPRQADDIIRHYLTDDLPLEQGVDAHALARVLVGDIYAQDEHRHVCDVCDEHGQWRAIHMSDVVSGAMLKNIVDRAKTRAVKASIETGAAAALSVDMLAMAAQEEFRESVDAILDADPVQWSRIAGFESGSVTRIRPAGDARTA